ncbi:MAG: DUF3122 domain-containing protein [Scytonema sp. PMC 1069.18]|nr:DUF3122 domain-containing protein [Scytonema sp. PMC 1069.18]MEC4881000.1 DUF3122 domain-containing protein [Scytonema sp. PMC 1070.18]
MNYLKLLFVRLLSLGVLIIVVFLGLGIFSSSSANAAIRKLQESPGQIVYQSRQTLRDQHGKNWQAIAFKRTYADSRSSFYLRLVAFPGVAEIDHTKALKLTDSLGKTLTATNTSSQIFTDGAKPEPNVGQYDLQPILQQLQPAIPLRLTIQTTAPKSVVLGVPPYLVQEWQTVFTQK